MTENSFVEPFDAVVVGATGGIGSAFTAALAASGRIRSVTALSRRGSRFEDDKIVNGIIDIENDDSVAAAAREVASRCRPALVLVATGLLHDGAGMQPEKTWSRIESGAMHRAFAVNTIGPALLARHFLPLLPRGRKSVFAAVSARVGSIGDNRLGGWVSYRASKAALNMVIRTLAIELKRRNPEAIIAGLHPGTVDTPLSKPFQGNVPDEKLFTPAYSAQKMLAVVDALGPDDSGRVFAWDGAAIPF